ncbi:chaperone protein DnaJ [Nitzschia inconspicua]|uniref:Chaperone protein DnaJ n=1 Tax=Nitzschia inconspicua TaxID=303405 RepID=A0A9K3PL94_9STRA|nr:chaperone protein DnaJ [Nitzschia inconspicua]KAG7365740.1 chaperone protein DnaJ [Nitzschia inconspicua]
MSSEPKPKKSKEELEREQKEAAAQLSQILKTSKPKNLGQGLGRGLNNILAGAVGGVGIAVMAPTLGLAAGLRGGGIVGGAFGLTAGAVVGVLGAAGLIVGGAVSGVTQIVRGVIAQPEAMMAPRQGKWWNDATGSWTLTDLSKTNVPDNDDDILGDIERGLDSHDNNNSNNNKQPDSSGEVVDVYYYEALEVDTTADDQKIKRQYYLMARKYHPDKNPGDVEAAEKFKTIAEAYQVLSDPQLRAKYNQEGRDGLSGDKTSTNDGHKPDASLLLAFLFGSDQFYDYVGRLATSTSAMLGDTPKLSLTEARTLQERRATRLAINIANRVSSWVAGDFEVTESKWTTEAEALSKASYGWELLQVIGMSYEVTALQFLGSADSGLGLPSIAKWAEGKKAKNRMAQAGTKNQWETMMATVDAMKVQAQFQEKLQAASSDDEKQALQREMENATTAIMLRIIWTTTTVDIMSSIHEACQMVFFDQSVDKEARKLRAQAIKKLGEIFQSIPGPQYPDGAKKDAKALFEEAAMAATLETIRRKDEATYEAGGYNHH